MVSSSHLYCMQCGAANMPRAKFCVMCGHSLQLDLSRPMPAVHAMPKIPSVTPATPPPSLLPQSLLKQRYRILAQIGKGGFGEVYKAVDSQFGGRLVAIKSMSLDGLNSREAIEAAQAFEREALMLANLMHPNLPSIYDYFNENRRSYLVMSFIEGMTLEDYLKLRGGRLPVEKVLPIGIQLCSVLGYLHKRQPAIIFRDLKPANVMRTPDRQLYLIDFGVARLFKHGQARDTIALGSPGYAAPEQYGKAQTTPQADIYSLGATLHHLLSGTDPSEAPFMFAPLHIAAYPDLNGLIMHMLETNPGKRPMSMSTVKQELQRIALGHSGEWAQQNWQSNALHYASEPKQISPSPDPKVVPGLRPLQPPKLMSTNKPVNNDARHAGQAQPPLWPPPPSPQQAGGQQQMFYQPSPPQSSKGILSRRTVLISGVTGLIVSGGLLTCLLTQRSGPVAVQADPVQPPQNPVPTMPPQPPNPALSMFVAVAWAPRSDRIVAGGGPGTVSVMDSAGNLINSYNGHTAPISSLAWSPDGKQVASASYDTTVQIWNPDTDKNIRTYRENIGIVQSLAWSPRGKYIASADYAHNVNVWNAISLKTLVTYKNHIDQVLTLAWSPDGKYVASGSADNTVQVWDPVTGNMVFNNHSHAGAVDSVAWSPDGIRIASASQDHTVRLWNALSGANVYIYPGHTAPVNSVAWSPDGRYIASGSMDTTVQIWHALDGHTVYTYRAHTGPVLSVAWSPSGRIVSVDADGNLHVWTAPVT